MGTHLLTCYATMLFRPQLLLLYYLSAPILRTMVLLLVSLLLAFPTIIHPLSCDDNAEWQEFLEKAYVGTHVHPTLKSFSRRKDWRSSWLSILEQFMKFDKKRRTNKEDFNERVKGIISETVSTLIEKKENDTIKSASVASVSLQSQLTRNNILKSTSKKGSITGINMRRILYHMTHRASVQDEYDISTETKSYTSFSSPSRSYEREMKPK